MIIAIDGPAASGKGTLAKRLADHFGLPCLDTGLLYRAVARDVRARGGALDDPAAAAQAARILDPASLDDPALRGYGIGDAASIVGRIPEVRAALLQFQQDFAAQPGGAVLDGRDIGTVVCPHADVKIFVTATPEVRAERRFLERTARGEATSYEAVLDDIRRRDERDAERSEAPMRPADDAVLLETSNLDIEAAFNTAVGVISRKVGQRGRS
ncbi:MAG: (d)CMP kinase [Hyphomonadaceae bacterium]|nr:(d)CMP kinase [Hyphomonadaceae bacterium]